jgi:threonine aldolase
MTPEPLPSAGMWEFRSDTFTRPSDAMRRAMATADVGDDVWGEDPTVIALQRRAADLLGKPAALFVASGTMGNAIGIGLHAARGTELYAHARSHVIDNEAGGPAALWGVSTRQLPGDDGFFDAATLREWIPDDQDDPHHAPSRLVVIENTSMAAMGGCWPLDRLAGIADTARQQSLAVHMDGARLLNAAVAQGVTAAAICQHVDTVSLCLSKGLGAPVGSVLAGSQAAITRAMRLRKLLGGGMRQAGVVAAAGLYALDHHIDRLADDHDNARRLADAIAATRRLTVARDQVETNIVLARCATPGDTAAGVCRELAAVGVLAAPYDATTIRFVTSLEVDRASLGAAIDALGRVLG